MVIVDWDVCTGCTICAKEGPWDTIEMIAGTDVEELLSEEITEAAFYKDFMQPQGLAAEWPVCHVIQSHAGAPIAGIVIYRREGGGALKVLCKDPSRQLARRLRACGGSVAVSATLEPLPFYRDVLGFAPDAALSAFPSPFDPAQRRILVLDPGLLHEASLDDS